MRRVKRWNKVETVHSLAVVLSAAVTVSQLHNVSTSQDSTAVVLLLTERDVRSSSVAVSAPAACLLIALTSLLDSHQLQGSSPVVPHTAAINSLHSVWWDGACSTVTAYRPEVLVGLPVGPSCFDLVATVLCSECELPCAVRVSVSVR